MWTWKAIRMFRPIVDEIGALVSVDVSFKKANSTAQVQTF